MNDALIRIAFLVTLCLGAFGAFVPGIPGVPLMYLSTIIFSILYFHFSVAAILVLGALTLLALFVEHASGLIATRASGASAKSVYAGAVGLIVGTIFFPPLGGLFGIFLGVLFAELFLHHDHAKAIRAASGSLVGTIAGNLIGGFIGLIFLIVCLFLVF